MEKEILEGLLIEDTNFDNEEIEEEYDEEELVDEILTELFSKVDNINNLKDSADLIWDCEESIKEKIGNEEFSITEFIHMKDPYITIGDGSILEFNHTEMCICKRSEFLYKSLDNEYICPDCGIILKFHDKLWEKHLNTKVSYKELLPIDWNEYEIIKYIQEINEKFKPNDEFENG
ncbi:hypothetical protein [Clostridium sp.]|uniref:hypothetical protein n=1 Tax=Clostridium sp. TaxID=1506 RepID=UPI003995A6A5